MPDKDWPNANALMHPVVYRWLQRHASTECTSLATILRRAVLDFMRRADPDAHAEVMELLSADPQEADDGAETHADGQGAG